MEQSMLTYYIIFTTLKHNANFRERHKFHDVGLTVRGQGDGIYSNLERALSMESATPDWALTPNRQDSYSRKLLGEPVQRGWDT